MAEKHHHMQEQENVELVRILGKDVRGDKSVLVGITKIKGISWSFANALCKVLVIDTHKKVSELDQDEMKKIEAFMKNPELPNFLKNRQKDFDSGDDKHLYGPDLNLQDEFDIKRLRKIKSYRGSRHAYKLPARGQRTKANFRKNRKKGGVKGGKK